MLSCGGPSVRFLTRYDGEVSEPLVGRQGSRVSMRVARGVRRLVELFKLLTVILKDETC